MFHALPEAPPKEAIASSSASPNCQFLICDMKSSTAVRQRATAVVAGGDAVGARLRASLGAPGVGLGAAR